jgi:hypothetical protein
VNDIFTGQAGDIVTFRVHMISPLTEDVYVFRRAEYPEIYQEQFAEPGSRQTF